MRISLKRYMVGVEWRRVIRRQTGQPIQVSASLRNFVADQLSRRVFLHAMLGIKPETHARAKLRHLLNDRTGQEREGQLQRQFKRQQGQQGEYSGSKNYRFARLQAAPHTADPIRRTFRCMSRRLSPSYHAQTKVMRSAQLREKWPILKSSPGGDMRTCRSMVSSR